MFDLGRSFLASVERSPDALAIVDGEHRLTYAEWYAEIGRVADGLAALSLRRGDRLAVILQNRIEMASLHWACQFLGIVVTPLNWRMKAEEIDYCLADAEAGAIIFDAVAVDAVAGARRARDLPRVAIGDCRGRHLPVRRLACFRLHIDAPSRTRGSLRVALYLGHDRAAERGATKPPRRASRSTRPCCAKSNIAVNERTLGVMPLYHTMGIRSLLAMALVDGAFICLPRFDAAAALRLIGREQVTNLYLVPTLYHDLVSHPDFAAADTSSVRKIGFAGAAMPDGLLKRVEAAFRPELFLNHYGSSEIYTFTIEPQAAAKPGSAGRAGINQRIRVVKLGAATADEIAAIGEEGEIIADMAGDEAFEGYWRRPDANTKALRSGWYFTGDTGYVDAAGDLFVTGRVDDMIISGGENISPAEIESVLSLHPAVAEVAVAGLPDERWGQRITAFVRRDGAVDNVALDAWCRQSSLADYKRPRVLRRLASHARRRAGLNNPKTAPRPHGGSSA